MAFEFRGVLLARSIGRRTSFSDDPVLEFIRLFPQVLYSGNIKILLRWRLRYNFHREYIVLPMLRKESIQCVRTSGNAAQTGVSCATESLSASDREFQISQMRDETRMAGHGRDAEVIDRNAVRHRRASRPYESPASS